MRTQATAKHRTACARYRATRRGRRVRRAWWRRWIAKAENRRRHNDRRRDLEMKRRGAHTSQPPTLEGVWKKSAGKCRLCGFQVKFPGYHDPTDEDSRATIDHIRPISKGGKHHWLNAQLAHAGCNRKRGAGEIPKITTAPVWAR